MKDFVQYSNRKFEITQQFSTLTDCREKPQIPIENIPGSCYVGLVCEMPSMNALDAFLKEEEVKKFFNSTHRKMVASDTTIERIYRTIKTDELKNILSKTIEVVENDGREKGVKGKVIGSVDGSRFGKRWANVFMLCGEVRCVVDYEIYTKRGNELNAAKKLIPRVLKGRKVDITVGDSLYLNKPFFKMCLKNNSHGLVKYTPDKDARLPDILRELENILDRGNDEMRREMYIEEGIDYKRMVRYKVESVREFKMDGIKESITAMRITEEKIKKDKKNEGNQTKYFIVTTYPVEHKKVEESKEITVLDCRELAKGAGRWAIEIQGFKQMNQLFSSKRWKFKNRRAWENMLLTIFILFNVFFDFQHTMLKKEKMEESKKKLLSRYTPIKYLINIIGKRFFLDVVKDKIRFDSGCG